MLRKHKIIQRKLTLLLIGLTAASSLCNAQVSDSTIIRRHTIDLDLGYDCLFTDRDAIGIETVYMYSPKDWVDVQGGLQISTLNSYALQARADFRINPRTHHNIELRNQYLYNLDLRGNLHHFNALLAVAYNQHYCYVAAGVMGNFFAPINPTPRTTREFQRAQLCYDVEGRVRPPYHAWNLALQFTNIDTFMAVHAFKPNMIFKTNYMLYDTPSRGRLDLKIDVGCEYSDVFTPAASAHCFYGSAGLQWQL